MVQRITCPRRMSEFGPWQRREGLDVFDSRDGTGTGPLNCSFCGSLDPETLLDWMANGALVTPTDKPYKLYVSLNGKREQKFYFPHLSKEQRTQFIAMYNLRDRPFKMAYPGYFYVLPYFATRFVQEQE